MPASSVTLPTMRPCCAAAVPATATKPIAASNLPTNRTTIMAPREESVAEAQLDRRTSRRRESSTSKSAKPLTSHQQPSIRYGKAFSVGGTHLDERKDGPTTAGPPGKTTG